MNHFKGKYKLSDREIDVIQEIVQGKSNKEAAGDLFVTEKTVKFHLTNIYRKVGVNSRAQLIIKVMFYKEPTTPEPAIAAV